MVRRASPMEPGPELDDEDLSSRGDARRANREIEEALARLAKELVELREGWLKQLELPEGVLDVVVDARAIQSAPARNRQLRLVRSALRGEDWSIIRARVDALHKHGSLPARLAPASAPTSRAPQWVARLLGEGQPAIEALLQVAPQADRTHLRTLVQNVRNAHAPDRRKRAEERLSRAIESLLR